VELSIFQLQKELEKEGLKHDRLVLHGDEPYLIKNFLNKLSEKAGGLKVLWGDEIDEEELTTALSGGSLFSAKPLPVVLKNPEPFFKRFVRKKKARESFLKRLSTFKTPLLIVFDRKLTPQDLSSEPYKSLLSSFTLVSAPKLSKDKVKALVVKRLSREGVKLPPKLLNLLLERTGYDLTQLRQEIDKLVAYAREGGKLDEEALERLLFPVTEESSPFELADAFFTKDYAKTLRLYEELLRLGYHPLQLQKLLTSYLLRLLVLAEEGPDKAAELGVKNPFLKHKLLSYLKKLSKDELKLLLERFWRADLEQKLYLRPPEESLRELFQELLLSS